MEPPNQTSHFDVFPWQRPHLSGPVYLLPQLDTESFALHGRATAMHREFCDQVDFFRGRRDPNGIPTDPPESLLSC